MQKPGRVKAEYEKTAGETPHTYEEKRWRKDKRARAGYMMTRASIERFVFPFFSGGKEGGREMYLEMGPGPGTWTKLFAEADVAEHYTLVDISGAMLAHARENLKVHNNIVFHESDFLQFTTGERFDCFFSSRALEYIDDKRECARHLFSLMKEGARGAVITKTPHYRRAALARRKTPELHRGQIAPAQLTAHLREAGFLVRDVRPVTFSFPLVKSARMDKILFSLFGRFRLNALSRFFSESYLVLFSK